jgi:hypothetical protein
LERWREGAEGGLQQQRSEQYGDVLKAGTARGPQKQVLTMRGSARMLEESRDVPVSGWIGCGETMKISLRKVVVRSVMVLGVLVVMLILSTGHYERGSGLCRLIQVPPLVVVDVGRADRWMLRDGTNNVATIARAIPRNAVEFPISAKYRMGIRYYSRQWWEQSHPDSAR